MREERQQRGHPPELAEGGVPEGRLHGAEGRHEPVQCLGDAERLAPQQGGPREVPQDAPDLVPGSALDPLEILQRPPQPPDPLRRDLDHALLPIDVQASEIALLQRGLVAVAAEAKVLEHLPHVSERGLRLALVRGDDGKVVDVLGVQDPVVWEHRRGAPVQHGGFW